MISLDKDSVDEAGTIRFIDLRLPGYFARDHAERDLPTGHVFKAGRRQWHVLLTMPELEEWLSDATYYSDCNGPGWDISDGPILQASARTTVKRCKEKLAQLSTSMQ